MNNEPNIILHEKNGVSLMLTPHVMGTYKSGKQYRKSIGYYHIYKDGVCVASYQDSSPKLVRRAYLEFERIARKEAR